LGHVTRKAVSEMTYNVSSGTLNSTIPYEQFLHIGQLDWVFFFVSFSSVSSEHLCNFGVHVFK